VTTTEPAADTNSEVDGLVRVLRWFVIAAAVVFVVLLGTGLYLVWWYRPVEALAWSSVQHVESSVAFGEHVRDVHRISARVLLPLLVATAVVAIVLAVRRRRMLGGALAAVAVVAAFGGSFSGRLLRWDQLALRAVTVGTNLRGYSWLWNGDQVRYALLGSKQISAGALGAWFVVHTVAIPLVLIAISLVMWRATRFRGPRARGGPPGRGTTP
jgi:quinol-cytochrome oxidoreductase complex cytochrome b subunit